MITESMTIILTAKEKKLEIEQDRVSERDRENMRKSARALKQGNNIGHRRREMRERERTRQRRREQERMRKREGDTEER